jgi:hypothetical protein
MHRLVSLTVIALPLFGCRPELPPLEYHGERVIVGSDVVDQVCEGTLIRMDREVELIESRLGLSRQDSRIAVYVVDYHTVDAYCTGDAANCTVFPWASSPFVVIDKQKFERAVAHEIVHARLASSGSVPMFDEGVAEAASPASCTRPAPDLELSKILTAKHSIELAHMDGAYYALGELVAWLLDEFGPNAVMNLMKSVDKDASSSTIQAQYREHFDRELEDDLLAHIRNPEDFAALPPEHFGCLAPPVNPSLGPITLVANLDCDSDLVHNDFAIDGGGYVEWTLTLDQAQTLDLVGEFPSGTSLTIEECGCIPRKGEDEYLLARPLAARETLPAGSYRLRWNGDLDEQPSLDVEIVSIHE